MTYKVEGFLDKNNDLLYRDLSQAMYACKHSLLKKLFPEGEEFHYHTFSSIVVALCCDYIKKYSRLIGFLYFYRPINIILSADWSDYIKDITRRLPKSDPKLYNRPIVCRHIGRSSADTSADDKWRATIT